CTIYDVIFYLILEKKINLVRNYSLQILCVGCYSMLH
ncbi:unnamed protein product, partial [Brassica rapa subsp. narinosa]